MTDNQAGHRIGPREPVDSTVCPLCGEPNQCGIAGGSDSCWCFNTAVPESALAGLSDADRTTRCICQRCLDAARTSPAVPSTGS